MAKFDVDLIGYGGKRVIGLQRIAPHTLQHKRILEILAWIEPVAYEIILPMHPNTIMRHSMVVFTTPVTGVLHRYVYVLPHEDAHSYCVKYRTHKKTR